VIISPPKKKSQKRLSKRDQKPGAATKRPAVRQEHRTLERALSFDAQHRRSMSRGPSNAIALMRSATPAVLTTFKREDSEPALSKLPTMRDDSRKRTLGLTRSISMANVDEARAAKKAKVDAELKDAISALRKPNRDVVSKAMEEAAERKASAVVSVKSKSSHRILPT
jgi:DNA replication regulator SLD3